MPTKLFTPLTIGRCELQHRVVMAPLTRYRADDAHVPQEVAAEYYAQRGATPGTLLITEATFIAEEAGGYSNVPGIWSDAQLQGWRRITDAVHAKGSFIFAQLWALGRAADPAVLEREGGHPYVSSSDVKIPQREDHPMNRKQGPHPRPLSVEEIKKYVGLYAQAARNAIEKAGFDGVEIHGANGYLVDQFTQTTANKRPASDPYTGATVDGRIRFAHEVAQACVDAVGADRVGIRLSPFSNFQGMGMSSEDVHATFPALIKGLPQGMAYLHLVESRIAGNADVESGEKIDFLAKISQAPVLIAGGFKRASAIDAAEAHPDSAIVFGRYFISNPDLPTRLRDDVALTPYDRSTFYTKGPQAVRGYTDYPAHGTSKM